MPLTLIKEDGTGRSDANSYASVADGDSFFAGHLYADLWSAPGNSARLEPALVMATQVLDAEWQFHGHKAVAGQALQWPRAGCPDPDGETGASVASDAVPVAIMNATCQLALKLLQTDRTTDPPGEGIFSEWTEFTGKKYDAATRRPVLPPWVQSWLLKYGVPIRKTGGMVRLRRV
jgi:hypothetical protein